MHRMVGTAGLSAAFAGASGIRTDSKDKADGKREGRPQPAIKIKAWDPKTPYIAALKRASAKQRYSV